MDDFTWAEEDGSGFRFDWDQSEELNHGVALNSIAAKDSVNHDQFEALSDLEGPTCCVCHTLIGSTIIYENKVAFCSESCWESVLYTAVDDFVLGGLSTWPLETFSSQSAKAYLIELVCKSFDGNTIIKLLRALQSSLSPKLFRDLLVKNVVAFNHFTNFLRKTGQKEVLCDILNDGGCVEASKLPFYCELTRRMDSIEVQEAERLSHRLRIFALTELSNDPRLQLMFEATTQLSELIQFQCQHESEWTRFYSMQTTAASNGSGASPSSTLISLPLGETIRIFAWMDKKTGVGSRVHQLRMHHKINDDLFRWLMVEPMILNSSWTEMDAVLLEKKWLKRQMQTHIPNDRLVFYLHALNAPPEIVSRYLSYSGDPDEVIDIALRLRMYSTALECCIKKRDPATLKELLDRIPTKEPEHSDILYYLSLPVAQWKENKR